MHMGLRSSTDIFQENKSELFKGFDMVRAYIDDVLVMIENDFEDHLKPIDRVIQRLTEAGLKVNAIKYY